MKFIVFLPFLLFIKTVFAQNERALAFQEDLIKTEISLHKGDYKVVTFIDTPRVAAHLNDFILQNPEKIYVSRNRKDSIQMTQEELQRIIEFFRDEENLTYTSDSAEQLISGDNYFGFLKANPNNVVISLSKPLFLRNNEFGVCFFSSFYGGGINGPSSLSIYIKENGHWERWFDLSSGMF